jgi:GNAT superfamily N-acetyltransferase
MSYVSKEMKIVNIDGCHEDSFDVEIDDGVTVDCSEIADQFNELIKDSGIRMLRNDWPISALIDRSGNVYGGIFGSYEMLETDLNDDYLEDTIQILTFSIVIDSSVRGLGLAERMIRDLIENKRYHVKLRADVVNPLMIKILEKIGFERIYPNGYFGRTIYELRK